MTSIRRKQARRPSLSPGPGPKGELCVIKAAKAADLDGVARYIKEGGDVNIQSSSTGRGLLHVSAQHGATDLVSLLLSSGANTDIHSKRGLTPLHLAAERGHVQASKMLLGAGADVNAVDHNGVTPLHLAAQEGMIDMARLLLQAEADKDCVEVDGWTPLHFCASSGSAGVARLLLMAGANAQALEAEEHNTPLHNACAYGHEQVVHLLLSYGARVDAVNKRGEQPHECVGLGLGKEMLDEEKAKIVEAVQERIDYRKGGAAYMALEEQLATTKLKVQDLEGQLIRASCRERERRASQQDGAAEMLRKALRPECMLCQAKVKSTVLQPCGHVVACTWCALREIKVCPCCEIPVQMVKALDRGEEVDDSLLTDGESMFEHSTVAPDESVDDMSAMTMPTVADASEIHNLRSEVARLKLLEESSVVEASFCAKTKPVPMPALPRKKISPANAGYIHEMAVSFQTTQDDDTVVSTRKPEENVMFPGLSVDTSVQRRTNRSNRSVVDASDITLKKLEVDGYEGYDTDAMSSSPVTVISYRISSPEQGSPIGSPRSPIH